MNTVDEVIAALDGTPKEDLEYQDIGSAAAIKKAESLGQRVVIPSETEMFIDLDGEEALNKFNKQLSRIQNYMCFSYEMKPSPSGEEGHFHVYCKVSRPISHFERILVQLMLGSDPVREYLSWALVTQGDPAPTLFFEKKEEICQ